MKVKGINSMTWLCKKQFSARLVPRELRSEARSFPTIYPAFEAFCFCPLAIFSYRTAYLIWLAINIVLMAVIIVLLRKNLPSLGQVPVSLWITGV